MLTESNVYEVTKSEPFKENSFSIKSSAGIFKILRDSLYSRKILAILREYGINGVDSHFVANKQDKPINVTLPQILNPVLKIRDFGEGLSQKDMWKIFCVYGESTKTEDNDTCGHFGIGAKVGFAYSSSFQITSIHKGIKSIYNAYLDESDCGKLALLISSKTDEESGVEIQININQRDINTVLSDAQELFQFWKVYPNVEGNDSFKKIVPEYSLLRDDSWGFLKSNRISSSGVVMGGIFYKLDAAQIPDITNLQTKILEKNLVIFADIGDISISASRELCAYTNKTINFVKSKLKTIEDEIRAEVAQKQAAVTTEYGARQLYYDLFNTQGQFGALAELFKTHIEIKFGNIAITKVNFDTSLFEGYIAKLYRDRTGKQRTKASELPSYEGWPIVQGNRAFQNLFYDLTQCGKGKIRNLARFYFEREKIEEDDPIWVIQPESIEQLTQICIDKGIPLSCFKDINVEVVIPKKVRANTPKDKIPSTNCRIYDPNSELEDDDYEYFDEKKNLAHANIDLNEHEGGYYLIRNYNDYYYESGKLCPSISSIHSHLMNLDSNFKKSPLIYTFTEAKAKKLGDQWKRIDLHLAALLKIHYTKTTALQIYSIDLNSGEFANLLYYAHKVLNDDVINNFISKVKFNQKVSRDDPYKYIALNVGITPPEAIEIDETELKLLNDELEQIKSQFPLLTHISTAYYQETKFRKDFINYAKLILKEKAQKEFDTQEELTQTS